MGNITRNFANLITADGTSGIPDGTVTNADLAGSISTDKLAGTINFKNIIINGDMSIAQRGTSTANVSTSQYPSLDRFQILTQTAGSAVFTVSQDTDVPSGQGFTKSQKIDVTTALDPYASANFTNIRYIMEGQHLQYLKKGTANAESLTLSFWVKSNKTGTYIAELFDADNSRQISKAYTIDSASTWEKKTITFAGDTTGTLDNDNARSLDLRFWLAGGTDYTSGTLNTSWNSSTNTNRAVGQVNFADNTANNFWITGVQLEAGTTASDFEFLPVDINRYRCFRYCYRIDGNASDQQQCGAIGFANGGSTLNAMMRFSPHMRTAPTVTEDNMSQTTTGSAISLTATFDNSDTSDCNAAGLSFSADSGSPFTTGNVMFPRVNTSTSAFIQFDAEL